ncbi:MAG: magnesium-translocating P-type ATPase [Candidatus Bathyarchaeota archaeon]|nr:magnesium-translocating P-type ATPase [Candidatus Termiticorpusculum sp.]
MVKEEFAVTESLEGGSSVVQPPLSSVEILGSSVEDLFVRLGSSFDGLSVEEAERRLEVFGRNELAKRHKRSVFVDFLLHFKSPLVIILMVAGLISGFLGEISNVVIIFTIVVISVILDFYQEHKAENAAEMLKEAVTTTATVIRGGVKQEIKLYDVVPGDVIYLSAGDITPADARVVSAKDLFINQSTLTGESFPVEKSSVLIKGSVPAVTEWNNYLFMGTSVVSGTAIAVVVRTGSVTEYGKIARKLVEKAPETEFERGVKHFGFFMMRITIPMVVFIFLIVSLLQRNLLQSLLFAVALAVGLTPELLPMIVTINLSRGAIVMSKKGVIVKRLASIDNFGSMNVLCTDKTGTLTENKITLVLHVNPEGVDDDKVLLYSYLNSFYQTGLKSPMDEAILVHEKVDTFDYKKVDEVPFDFVRRRVSVVVESDRQKYFISKGAPEEILKVCSFCELSVFPVDFSDELRQRAEAKYYELSAEGFRVLGVAYKKLKEDKAVYSVSDECDMVFLGFMAFLDPPKETAKESIRLLTRAGIELKILTGDNEQVTRKTCESLGFEVKGTALGNEISQMSDETLARIVEEANVFARVTPVQKERIISLLKSNGHVVGFMGDGINDSPSLKSCDVGISVNNAVDVAKESADIILLKNDLTVLAEGVLEGRKTFGNTMKYIMMSVSSNFGNMFSFLGATLILYFFGLDFLPMLPIQILLNNLLYDISQSAITTDDVDSEYVEKPKRWDIGYIKSFMFTLGPVSSLFDFLTFIIMIFLFLPFVALSQQASMFQTAWFVMSIVTQTIIVFVIRTRHSPFWKSKPGKYLFLSSIAIIAIAMVIPFTEFGEKYFKFSALPWQFFVALICLVLAYITLAEIVKRWFHKRNSYYVEQLLVPQKRGLYLSKRARLVQDVVAVICLRVEDEISSESLMEDLKKSLRYSINNTEVVQILNHLHQAGLISVDWDIRVIQRQGTISEYVTEYVKTRTIWSMVSKDWVRIHKTILDRYGGVNDEYVELFETQKIKRKSI